MPSPAEAPEIEHSRKTKKIKEETNLNTHCLQFCQQVRDRASVRGCVLAARPQNKPKKKSVENGAHRHRRASLSICFLFFWRNFRQILI